MKRDRPTAADLLLGACIAALAVAQPVSAQAQGAPEAAPSQAEAAEAPDLLEPNEVDALVAPVVFYPDPLLSLVLQASISPVELVEAATPRSI